MIDNETLLYQLIDDFRELFDGVEEYQNVLIKKSYDGDYEIKYPLIVVEELDNRTNRRFFDGEEHIIDVGYQISIYAEQSITKDAHDNAVSIRNIIKHYLRGDRYKALEQMMVSPIMTLDNNVKYCAMRYIGRIDIDTNTIYRRN